MINTNNVSIKVLIYLLIATSLNLQSSAAKQDGNRTEVITSDENYIDKTHGTGAKIRDYFDADGNRTKSIIFYNDNMQ